MNRSIETGAVISALAPENSLGSAALFANATVGRVIATTDASLAGGESVPLEGTSRVFDQSASEPYMLAERGLPTCGEHVLPDTARQPSRAMINDGAGARGVLAAPHHGLPRMMAAGLAVAKGLL